MKPSEDSKASRYRLVRFVSAFVSIGALLVIVRSLPLDSMRDRFESHLSDLGPWGPVAFVGIYVLATVAMLPGSMLTLVGAAVFGFWTAYLSVTVGSVAGAACSFLIARYAARRRVEEFAKSSTRFAAIDEAISEGGWKIVALLRLSPAIPFNLQNYLYGLTSIRFWPYVLTSWLAMIPGTLMYVYIGHAAGQAVTNQKKTPVEWALFVVGLLATIVVTVYVTRVAKRKLEEKTQLAVESNDTQVPVRFPLVLVLTAVGLVMAAVVVLQKA